MTTAGPDRVGRRREPLARAALWGAAAPILITALLAVSVGEIYVLALHFLALPLSFLVGVGLGSAALVRIARDGSGGRVVAVMAIVIGSLSAFLLLYVFLLNPN